MEMFIHSLLHASTILYLVFLISSTIKLLTVLLQSADNSECSPIKQYIPNDILWKTLEMFTLCSASTFNLIYVLPLAADVHCHPSTEDCTDSKQSSHSIRLNASGRYEQAKAVQPLELYRFFII